MTQRVMWTPMYSVGHDLFDAQHQRLLALCNQMADHCRGGDGDSQAPLFDEAFAAFKALVREHLVAEASALSQPGEAGAEDLDAAREQFDAVVNEIATTAHFDREELQRWLAFWCIGHLTATVQAQRAALA
jgi:hemerythrin